VRHEDVDAVSPQLRRALVDEGPLVRGEERSSKVDPHRATLTRKRKRRPEGRRANQQRSELTPDETQQGENEHNDQDDPQNAHDASLW
jgi:hypothetical protein